MERIYIFRDEDRKANCLQYLNNLAPNKERPFQVKISLYKKKRSVQMNARYWAVLTCIAQEAARLGITDKFYEPEYWHEYYKRKFLGKKVVINGDVLLLPESSANKSTIEFMDYMNEVEADAAGMGIIIPDPDEA